jgi:hypothetical protein
VPNHSQSPFCAFHYVAIHKIKDCVFSLLIHLLLLLRLQLITTKYQELLIMLLIKLIGSDSI